MRGEDFGDDDASDENGRHYGDDDREGFLCVGLTFLGEEACVNRNEGDGGSASGNDVIEPVREREGGNVGIDLSSGAELVGDIGLADESDDTGKHNGRHEEHGRGEGAVLVRRAEEAS